MLNTTVIYSVIHRNIPGLPQADLAGLHRFLHRPSLDFQHLIHQRESRISVLVSQFTADSQRFQIEAAFPDAGTGR
jgi:hypothetical protein